MAASPRDSAARLADTQLVKEVAGFVIRSPPRERRCLLHRHRESVDVYCTGLTTDAVLLPQVVVGDRMAAVVAMSTVPGFPGVSRVRIRVPSDIATGIGCPCG